MASGIDFVEVQQSPLSYGFLYQNNIQGVNGWLISCNLETFLASWISKGLKIRRRALCGGEVGNGLEM